MMDAVEYLKERTRMINHESDPDLMDTLEAFEDIRPAEAVRMVSEWSKEHPRKTNAQKFEEVFGENPENMCQPMSWWNAEYKEPGAQHDNV